MSARLILLASGLLVASLTPAFSESVTATITAWDPSSRTITLEDQSQFASIPSTVAVPQTLKAGDVITINYEASENGVDAINRIEITTELAKRQAISSQKRG
jgi:hypothetical protein